MNKRIEREVLQRPFYGFSLSAQFLFVFCRALFSASAGTATLESSARNLTPATIDLAATTAPALTLDRGVKDATSHAVAPQVCVSM